MVTDVAVDENLDIFIDDTNDIGVVTGSEQLEQSVALDILDVTRDFVGRRLSANNVGILEERIRQSLESDEQLGPIESVVVEEYNRQNNTIVSTVRTRANNEFELEVNT